MDIDMSFPTTRWVSSVTFAVALLLVVGCADPAPPGFELREPIDDEVEPTVEYGTAPSEQPGALDRASGCGDVRSYLLEAATGLILRMRYEIASEGSGPHISTGDSAEVVSPPNSDPNAVGRLVSWRDKVIAWQHGGLAIYRVGEAGFGFETFRDHPLHPPDQRTHASDKSGLVRRGRSLLSFATTWHPEPPSEPREAFASTSALLTRYRLTDDTIEEVDRLVVPGPWLDIRRVAHHRWATYGAKLWPTGGVGPEALREAIEWLATDPVEGAPEADDDIQDEQHRNNLMERGRPAIRRALEERLASIPTERFLLEAKAHPSAEHRSIFDCEQVMFDRDAPSLHGVAIADVGGEEPSGGRLIFTPKPGVAANADGLVVTSEISTDGTDTASGDSEVTTRIHYFGLESPNGGIEYLAVGETSGRTSEANLFRGQLRLVQTPPEKRRPGDDRSARVVVANQRGAEVRTRDIVPVPRPGPRSLDSAGDWAAFTDQFGFVQTFSDGSGPLPSGRHNAIIDLRDPSDPRLRSLVVWEPSSRYHGLPISERRFMSWMKTNLIGGEHPKEELDVVTWRNGGEPSHHGLVERPSHLGDEWKPRSPLSPADYVHDESGLVMLPTEYRDGEVSTHRTDGVAFFRRNGGSLAFVGTVKLRRAIEERCGCEPNTYSNSSGRFRVVHGRKHFLIHSRAGLTMHAYRHPLRVVAAAPFPEAAHGD